MGNMKKISNKTKGAKKIAEFFYFFILFLRWRLEKNLLRNCFANWNISNKAREVSLKSAPAFFWPWPCLAPADREPLPIPPLQSPLHTPGGTPELQWGWKQQTQDMENNTGKIQPDAVELSKCSCSTEWYFMSLQLQLQTSQVYTELSGPSASIHWDWQRLHFPWEDSFFQNLGSIDPGQHMTNSAAVSHDGCVSLTTQQKQSDCQETLSENNFISFHLPSNQLLEKLICFAAAHEKTWTKS